MLGSNCIVPISVQESNIIPEMNICSDAEVLYHVHVMLVWYDLATLCKSLVTIS